MIDKYNKKRGGARPGAGRPKNDSQLYAFRAGGDIRKFIECQENKTMFILDCISQQMEQQKVIEASKNKCSSSIIQTQDEPNFSSIGRAWLATDVEALSMNSFDVRVVAGFPIPLDNDERAQKIDVLRMLCPYPEATYLVQVEGDSMIDSNIHSGDILVVDKSNRNPSENDVAMCELNGEYTVKFVRSHHGKHWLVPANPNYPEIEITEGDDFNVWGVVTFVIHRPVSV